MPETHAGQKSKSEQLDFANYFVSYGYLYHQKDMLEDQQRMTAYHDAVRLNPALFRGSLVALG